MQPDDRPPPSHAGSTSGPADVWWLDIAGLEAKTVEGWSELLDAQERARADRLGTSCARQAFIAAHGLLRTMLTRHAGLSARRWRFVVGPQGKPALHPEHAIAGLEFNLSHTRGAVACGVVWNCAIGVDIEAEDGDDGLDVARAHFAPAEIGLLQAAPPGERRSLFFQLWTLKEAYIKACGSGLFMTLDRFAFSLAPPRISVLDEGCGDTADWRFLTMPCPPRHRLSVALRSTAPRIILTRQATAADIGP